jgi:molybdate transport system regulatory protein
LNIKKRCKPDVLFFISPRI